MAGADEQDGGRRAGRERCPFVDGSRRQHLIRMPEVDLGIAGKVALVTASTRGIGLGIAQALAAEGARVAIAARTEADVRRTAESLGGLGIAGDLMAEDGPRRAVEETIKGLGPVDILINNLAF